MPTIVIDPGHGGSDPGAVHLGRNEKDDNLRLALAVESRLKSLGYNVVMTRNSDEYVSLAQRSNISNNANADLFVSLHRNASTNPLYNGLTTYVYTSPSAASLAAAQNINSRIANAGVQTNHGIMYENFAVLRNTVAPAVLVELNFISNAYDNILFDTRFEQYADAIAAGIAATVGPASPGGGTATDRMTRIKSIQTTLNNRYGAGLVVDGYYGPKTKRALVQGLQKELNWMYNAGLATDGVFGPKTKAAIRSQRYGNNNYLVWLLQAMLFLNGYDIAVDGIFGSGTQNAVINFQRAHGLAADGIAGPLTFETLINSI